MCMWSSSIALTTGSLPRRKSTHSRCACVTSAVEEPTSASTPPTSMSLSAFATALFCIGTPYCRRRFSVSRMAACLAAIERGSVEFGMTEMRGTLKDAVARKVSMSTMPSGPVMIVTRSVL